MIKLFRNIRNKLIKENKTVAYFKYAIGEIVLVVIGILLALQINTWNQNRLSLIEEQQILKNLKADFDNNKDILQSTVSESKESIRYCLAMLNHTGFKEKPETARTFDSILNGIFNAPAYSPVNGTLDEIINSGKLSVIMDEDLRKKLSSWKPIIEIIKGRFDETKLNQNYLNEYMLEHGNWLNADQVSYENRSITFPTSGFIVDNRKLLEDQKFENMVENIAIGLDNYLIQLNRTERLLDDILKQINTDIKND
ncbi:DUF6090 family protein [Gaetbulibacter aestuarii]|uniref:DUF6090 family protein n=1 Tax=Gaetbulibacter aestuarii TaxID=1502358 RepID=A0ABW7MV86_9FLAO